MVAMVLVVVVLAMPIGRPVLAQINIGPCTTGPASGGGRTDAQTVAFVPGNACFRQRRGDHV